MEDETDVAKPEVSNKLNLQHMQGKTLTGYSYHDEEDGKDKIGFVGIYDDVYYYLKQTKNKGEKWIKCSIENLGNFQNEITSFPPKQNLL